MTERLPLAAIRPPRFKLRRDVGNLTDLKASMQARRLLQPILVRKVGQTGAPSNKEWFELVAGHRRWVAAAELGWTDIEANIIEATDAEAVELSLVENIQRGELDPYEEADAYRYYIKEKGYGSGKELAAKLGKSPAHISQRLLLLNIPEEEFTRVKSALSVSHAEQLARLPEVEIRDMADALIETKMSSDQAKAAVDYRRAGLSVEQAVHRALEYADAPTPTLKGKQWDAHRVAREQIVLTLQQALHRVDFNMADLPDTEQAVWQQRIRAPLHGLTDVALKTEKEIGA